MMRLSPVPATRPRLLFALLSIIVAQCLALPAARSQSRSAAAPDATVAEHRGKLSAAELTTLAARYEHAEGVPRDHAQAISLYCAAASQGHAAAQYALGWMHAHGRGIVRNDAVARHFFEMAARQGHEQAHEMLRHVAVDTATVLSPCPQQTVQESGEPASLPDYPRGRVFDLVNELAPRYGIDPQLALAVIQVESAFNPRAVSSRNAQGLMQLTPDTARRFRVKNTFDPEENIRGGLAYLQWLLAFFKGNVTLALAAYNAGEGAVTRYRGVPPYPETRQYVQKLSLLYRNNSHPFDAALAMRAAYRPK